MPPVPGLAFAVALVAALAWTPGEALADGCAGASSQTAMNACADAALRDADAKLNDFYGKIAARLKERADVLQKFVLSERAWLRFRDADCAFAASGVAGGSAAPMLAANCRAALTQARVKQLDTYLSCQEGDLSCPVPPE